jgi:hypothetical protein
MPLDVRERPPTRLVSSVKPPGSALTYRWAADEDSPENVPTGLTFSSTMPGGYEQATCTLARKASGVYPDLAEFADWTIRGVGGQVAWQGRLETQPRASGDKATVQPGAVGYQALLSDDNAAREIFLDGDLTKWGPISTQNKLYFSGAGNRLIFDPSTIPDVNTGLPSLGLKITAPWAIVPVANASYDSKGVPIWYVGLAWTKGPEINAADTNWGWGLSVDDADKPALPVGQYDETDQTPSAGPSAIWVTSTTHTRKFAEVFLWYSLPFGAAGNEYTLYITGAVVAGWAPINIPLTGVTSVAGGFSGPGCYGFYASEAIGYTVNKYTTLSTVDGAGQSTIAKSQFLIPQGAYTEPTTAGAIIADLTKYELMDYWVYAEGPNQTPSFHLAYPGNHGRNWRARVGPAQLKETGLQADRIFNGAVIAYTDVSGQARTAGPPGSGCDIEDPSLYDASPLNPATAAGLDRYSAPTSIGVSVPAAAIKVGQAFLAYQRQISTAGQASIVGHVQDDRGVYNAAWAVQAGDTITFTDAHDAVPRRVVKASYDDDSATCQVDLDGPAEGLQALLARFAASITGIVS